MSPKLVMMPHMQTYKICIVHHNFFFMHSTMTEAIKQNMLMNLAKEFVGMYDE